VCPHFLCSVVLWSQRPCDGPIPSLPKCLQGLTVSEDDSDLEQDRGPNTATVQASKQKRKRKRKKTLLFS